MNAKTILTAAALAAAFVTGAAQASTSHGEVYGYTYRVNDQRSAFTDGARQGKFDSFSEGARISNRDGFTEGAHIGNRDAFTDGARISNRDGLTASISNRDGLVERTIDPYLDGARFVAGLDRSGVSASPARKVDPYLDGARGNEARNPYFDGARTPDVYTDGALA
ncbi:hypothetical protein ACUXAV_002458 [Cupriavidus metallidurans]|uniref:Protein involved in acute metal response (CopQ/CzcJ/MmrQ-like) n=1 Tax=Cupriavidus metallidurans (strain ATCC 43123 / DSM 2839 / NBRC 102507 / CH34) TaxID=266264 RepID=Q1LFM2_CUPMC|nr:hypothetical protein [Cupriavidus metallidurans]ABF11054.1 protein involved in acute metal response (CopQ/CzcJ/MmrQ-like) [Cupriavidus metallidurans CH34]KWW39471.1 hypothetical protein AU374_00537 [Cupriavidus metallidurans]MDE4920688.1 copper resistance protein CopQ [Cupriavidus metallidurans]QGS33013.1 copper resistance protein CopQ [Cupriavidus metallidurans]UBM07562.1 copper resistance protein CopQ [Cupriavidus metallidurans]